LFNVVSNKHLQRNCNVTSTYFHLPGIRVGVWKASNVKTVTRNQLVALLAIAGLVSTVATVTGTAATVFARSHIHLWLPYGGHAHLWGSGSAPEIDVHCGSGFGWTANVQC
jgi:hypothetical protein